MALIRRAELEERLLAGFRGLGMPEDKARLCAGVVTESTFDGVLSHGAAMVPGFADRIRRGVVDVHAAPRRVARAGATERWDGGSGIGIWNATRCTERAMALALRHGVGCVGLRNTNHWFRAGTYGWQAARAGFAFMCWTNTVPNMPAWGARTRSVGNNPMVVALPHPSGPVVLDMAMSQFALGKLARHARSGTPLPVPGGTDREGRLTTDAAAIVDGGAALPAGYWKGSGLALCLDLLAVFLSGGRTTAELARQAEERDVSQVFVAFRAPRRAAASAWERACQEALDALHGAEPLVAGEAVRYPGEGASSRRERNAREGLLLDDELWSAILSLAPA